MAKTTTDASFVKRRSQDVREKGATSATGATRNSEASG